MMHNFELIREVDETGISGTGTVAEGVVFSDGRVAIRWMTNTASTVVYDRMEDVVAVHSHAGRTKVDWLS